ncbi:hypothetical protein M404DRAFT_25511 [Pisolithus tinctorius Marx 270]|uniref:Uncharacterized protein n=1 Tax=Pisolithus tinctorius Marx 270 TaxID=870435 RepID=A0A0C3J8N3_PISTI|nr:hypothetical protein M404DRAFT_25511 [Pisolithus tinctorius Marx 270]
MATGVSLQESYLRGRGNERSGLGIPAVSRNMHQLTNDPFRSKIPLKFKAERLEEHPKPTGVEVEGLEILTGSPETDRLAYEEVIDSHRAPQHMNHIESKVIARRIRVEEPSRLVIRRKPPEEILRIEMLKHAARVDDLALEMFHGSAVPAIYILFENPSRESTRALGIRTCRGSPAMLTKRSHVTALHVVAARTQVILHTDDSRVIDRLRKIVTIGYEEWGEWRTVWKLLRLRAMAAAEVPSDGNDARRAWILSSMAQSAGQWLGKVEYAVRWEQSTTSAGTGLDGPRFCFDTIMLYLQLSYSREGGYMRQRPTDVQAIAIQEMTTTVLNAERWPCEARTAVICRRSARSTDIELDGSQVCFDFGALYLHLFYSRDSRWLRRNATDILAIATQDSTASYERAMAVSTQARVTAATALDADRRPHEEKIVIRGRRGATSADTEHYGSRFRFDVRAFYLQSFYSREVGYLQRTTIVVQETMTNYDRRLRRSTTNTAAVTTAFYTDRRTREARTAVRWKQGARSADNELDGSKEKWMYKTTYK